MFSFIYVVAQAEVCSKCVMHAFVELVWLKPGYCDLKSCRGHVPLTCAHVYCAQSPYVHIWDKLG